MDSHLKETIFDRISMIEDYAEYSNASEPPFYRLRATSDFNTLEPPQTQDIVMEP